MKKLFLLTAILSCLAVFAQSPYITSLTSHQGKPGDTITINGLHFGAANTSAVFLGKTRAQILSSTNNSFTIKVPNGVGNVEVDVFSNGKYGHYKTYFSYRYHTDSMPYTRHFGPLTKLGRIRSVNYPDKILPTYDFDSDGLADYTIEYYYNSIALVRNTGPDFFKQSISQLDFNVDMYNNILFENNVKFADINNDLKIDIVRPAADANGFDIYINTSTPGKISFEKTFKKLSGQSNIFSFEIGDLNNDGYNDLVFTSHISINVAIQNPTLGFISSLDNHQRLLSADKPRIIALADLNADYRKELIYYWDEDLHPYYFMPVEVLSGYFIDSLQRVQPSLIKNQRLFTNYTTKISLLKDLNQDQKPEFLFGNSSHFMNKSLSTDSFVVSSANFKKTAGVTYYEDINGDGYEDALSNATGVAKNVSTIDSMIFRLEEKTVPFASFRGCTSFDVNGDGFSDLVYINDIDEIYCQYNISTQAFITSVSTKTALRGDKIRVTIQNNKSAAPNNNYQIQLSDSAGNFNTITTIASKQSNQVFDTIWATIPNNIPAGNKYKLKLYATALNIYSTNTIEDIKIIEPITIDSIWPMWGDVGDVVTIEAQNLPQEKDKIKVKFGTTTAEILEANNRMLKVRVPKGAAQTNILIESNGLLATSTLPFCYKYATNPAELTFGNYVNYTFDDNGYTKLAVQNKMLFTSLLGSYPALALTAQNGPSLEISFNSSGTGAKFATFNEQKGNSVILATTNPQIAAFMDLNRDGDDDGIIYSLANKRIAIFHGSENMSYNYKVQNITTENNFKDLAVKDLNLDGKMDIVTLHNNPKQFSVYRNISSIRGLDSILFDAPYNKPLPSSIEATKFEVIDINGDYRPDIIILDSVNARINIFQNNDSANSLYSFAHVASFNVAPKSNHIVLSDLNHDGKPDIVLSNKSNKVFYYLNNITSNVSANHFSDSGFVNFTSEVNKIQVLDLNNDAKPDLYNYNELKANNYSGGIFTAAVFTNITNPLTYAESITVCDVNLDGKSDILGMTTQYSIGAQVKVLFANNLTKLEIVNIPKFVSKPMDVKVLYNSGNTQSSNQVATTINVYELGVNPISLVYTNTQNTSAKQDTFTIPETVLQEGKNYAVMLSNLYGNSVVDTFEINRTIRVTNGTKIIHAKAGSNIKIHGQNLDLVDWVRVGGKLTNIKQKSNNELTLTVPFGMSTQGLEVGKYNQQSIKTDIVVNYTYWRDTAINTRLLRGRFKEVTYKGKTGELQIDLNNDGHCEIINTESRTIYNTQTDSLLFAGIYRHTNMKFADLNGDSKMDMLAFYRISQYDTNEIRIYINATENNVLKFHPHYAIPVSPYTQGIDVFDFDANGKPDILVYGNSLAGSPKFALYHNNLNSNIVKDNSFIKVNETSEQTYNQVDKVEFIDLNNDGEPELVTSESKDNNRSIRVYKISLTPNLQQNCGLIYQFKIPLNYATALSKTLYAFKDLNNDNLPELVYWDNEVTLKIHPNNSREGILDSNLFSNSFNLSVAYPVYMYEPDYQLLFADLDADKRVDIMVKSKQESISVIKNKYNADQPLSTSSFLSSQYLIGGNTELYPGAILDFNQDGKYDFIGDEVLLIQNDDVLSIQDFPATIYTVGDTLPVKFNITSAYFTLGNTYHVEISDTNGMFNDNTITIASVNSTNSDTIFAKIPENLTVSHNYKLRVRTTQPVSYSVNSVDLDVRTLPKIFSFEPLKQVIGGLVTLHGKNFSPIPSNNIVYLGDVRCEIISAYSDELVVKIPQSASFDKFRVWVNNLTSTSTMWFTPIFNAVIGAQSSFVLKRLAKLNIPTSPTWGFYDMNGDGKVEYLTDKAEYTFHHDIAADSLTLSYYKANSSYTSTTQYYSRLFMRDLFGTGQLHACRTSENCNVNIGIGLDNGEFNHVFHGNHTLNFSFNGNCGYSSRNNLLVEDFNQDGIIDFAVDGSYGSAIGYGGRKYRTNPYKISNSDNQALVKFNSSYGSNWTNGNHAYDADGDSLQELVTTSVLYLNQSTKGKTDSYQLSTGKIFDRNTDKWFLPLYLDNDNKMDHAIAREDSLILFRNTSNIGVITDQRFSACYAGGEIKRMLTADLNGDQMTDIVTMRYNYDSMIFSVAESIKNGINHAYNYRILGSLKTPNFRNNLQMFVLDDIDNDGKQDVLISNVISDSSIYYFKNTTPTFNIKLYQKNYCVGDTLNASIDVSNFAFDANNIFSVQLSDALGSFNNPTTLINTNQKGEQLIPLPLNVLAGNRYKIRVVSSSPADTGFITTDSINIGSLPNVNLFLQAGNVLCATDSVKLSVQHKGVSNLKWYRDGAYTGFTDSTITVNKTGTYLLKATSGGCTLTSIDTLIKFLPPVKSSFNLSQQLLCHGDTATVTLSKTQGIKSYQWFKNDTLLTTQTQPLLQINSSGKYSTILVDSNDCSSEIDTNIVFNTKPIASFNITGRTINCKEDSVILTASNIHPKNTYTWHTNRVTLVTTGSSTVVKSTGSYSLLVVDSNGCSNQSSDVVIGKFNPTIAQITSNKNPVLCGNDSILLSYTTNRYLKTVYWRKNNVYSNTDTGYFKVKQAGVYGFYAIDSNNCQYTSDDLNIDSSNYPNTNLIGSVTQPLCEGDTVILSTAHQSGNQYKWFVNNIEIIGKVQPTFPVTDSLPVKVRITNNRGCSSISNDTFFVFKNSPQQSAILGLSNICSGDSIVLRSTDSTSSGYVWYRNNVKLNNDTLVSLKVKLNGTYGLKVKNQEGCQSIQTEKTVSYLPLPILNTTTTTMTICSGDSARLFATSDSTTGRTYTWYRNNIIENNWDTIGSCWIKNAGFYKVTVTNLAGCKRSKDIGTLTVNTRPNVTFTASPSSSFCSNDSIRLNLYYTQGYSHIWYRNNQFFNGSATILTIKDSASYHVVVTGNANCRTTTNVITTNKIPLPNTTFTITPNDSFCSGDSAKLSAFDQPNNQYKWYRNNMELMGQTASELWTKQPGLYKLYIRNGSCNATSTPLTISMLNKPNTPVINIHPSNTFCFGDSVMLSTSNVTGMQYKWLVNNLVLTEQKSHELWAKVGGDYQVSANNGFCSNISVKETITEVPLPVKPTISRSSDTLYSSYTQNNNWYFNGILVASNQNYFKPTQSGIYTIEAVTNEGCKSDTANYNWNSTGLNTYSTLNSITIYPNPSKGKVFIETAEEYSISVFNQLGQLVYNGILLPNTTNTISLSTEAGVYTVNLSNQKSTYTTKLVITN